MKNEILTSASELFKKIKKLELQDRIELINELRKDLAKYSPFNKEPVDCIQWVPQHQVVANDYNPNNVAGPEMKLLEISIDEDGYTQPIVSWKKENEYEVVDGFHRNRVGKESKKINKRIHGYLPLVVINDEKTEKGDRIASTIRHNRARGKHKVNAMSEIVLDLKKRNWNDAKIGRELGMDPDEVLRLCQITGLAEMFSDQEFSQAWTINSIDETDALNDHIEVKHD